MTQSYFLVSLPSDYWFFFPSSEFLGNFFFQFYWDIIDLLHCKSVRCAELWWTYVLKWLMITTTSFSYHPSSHRGTKKKKKREKKCFYLMVRMVKHFKLYFHHQNFPFLILFPGRHYHPWSLTISKVISTGCVELQ